MGVESGSSKLTVFDGRSERTKGFQSISLGSDKITMDTIRGMDHIKRGDVMEGNWYFPRGRAYLKDQSPNTRRYPLSPHTGTGCSPLSTNFHGCFGFV